MAITVDVNLKDGVSGPAKAAAGAVGQARDALGQFVKGASSAGSGLSGIAGGLGASLGGWSMFISKAGEALEKIGEFALKVGEVAIELGKFALETADAHRTLLLQTTALTGSSAAAGELVEQIDSLAASGIASKESLVQMGKGLAAAGLKGEELKTALTGVTDAGALLGTGASEAATKLFEKIEAGGGKTKVAAKAIASMGLEGALKPGIVTADQLNNALTKKFGGGAKDMALGLKAQMAGLHEKLEQLFDGIDPGPLLEGLKSLLSIFDKNSATGKALKAIISDAFNAIGKVAAKVFPAIKMVMLEIIIAGLKIAIALKPAGKEFEKLWDAMAGGTASVGFLKILVDQIAIMARGAVIAIKGILMLVSAISSFVNMAKTGASAATALIDGLVSGIGSGVGRAVNAVKNLGKSIYSGLMGAIGAHSPSVLFKYVGQGVIGEGLAQGVEASVPRVSGSTKTMAAGALKGTSGAPAQGMSGRGGSVINIAAINIEGAGQSALEITELMVATTFERIALSQGLG